jgi:hypothetical protein
MEDHFIKVVSIVFIIPVAACLLPIRGFAKVYFSYDFEPPKFRDTGNGWIALSVIRKTKLFNGKFSTNKEKMCTGRAEICRTPDY